MSRSLFSDWPLMKSLLCVLQMTNSSPVWPTNFLSTTDRTPGWFCFFFFFFFTPGKKLLPSEVGAVSGSWPDESAYQREAAICQHRQPTAGGGDARCLNKDWQDGRWQETDFPPFLALLQEKRLTIRALWCLAVSRCWLSFPLLSSNLLTSLPPFFSPLFSLSPRRITKDILQLDSSLLNLLISLRISHLSLEFKSKFSYFQSYCAIVCRWCALIVQIMIAFYSV